MEKNRKELKSFSIVVLVVTAISLIGIIVNACVNGIPRITEIYEGMTEDMIQISSVISFVLTFVIFIPQIYVGVKGIKIANGAKSGKAHIVWAFILAVLAGIAAISGIVNIIEAFSTDALLNLVDPAIDLVMFIFYLIYAHQVAREN